MVDGAKLDTASKCKCKPKGEKERTTTSPNKSTRTPTEEIENINELLLTFTLETILRERLLVIIHPRREVWVCIGVREPDPTQRRGGEKRKGISYWPNTGG
jgi:hypothetical protein